MKKNKYYIVYASSWSHNTYATFTGYYAGQDEKGHKAYGAPHTVANLDVKLPHVYRREGRKPKVNSVCLTAGGGDILLSQKVLDLFQELNLDHLYEKIPIMLFDKDGKTVFPNFQYKIAPKVIVKYNKDENGNNIYDENGLPFEIPLDIKIFTNNSFKPYGFICNEEVRASLENNFPSEFDFTLINK